MRAESEFEGQCVKDLRALGYLVYTHADSPRNRKNSRSDSGYPDITFAGRGRVGFIECKMPRQHLKPSQIAWREDILWAGQEIKGFRGKRPIFYAIATPDNWDAILQELA